MTIARNDLPLDAVSINGSYIEDGVTGYMTLRAVGREVTPRELTAVDRIADGSILTNSRYPARSITVHYIIKRDTLAHMRESMDTLKRLFDVSGAKVIFNGDSDYYYIGTPTLNEDITEGWNAIVGTYTINCFDPFKYSVAEYTSTAVGGQFSVTYNGTYKGYPTFITTFPSSPNADGDDTSTNECGFVGFVDQRDHILQFGDPEQKDWGDVTYPATVPLNKTFASTSGWSSNSSAVLANATQVGSISVSADKYIFPYTYGTGSSIHGPSLSKIITGETPPIGKNYTFTWKQYFGATKDQYGGMCVILWNNDNGTRTLVSAIRIYKGSKDTNCIIYAYAGDTNYKASVTVPCSKIGTSSMKKVGNKITFNIAGKTLTCSSNTITDLIANEVTFQFTRNGTASPITQNRVYSCKLQRSSFNNYEDIPNIFAPGDVLTVDTADAGVYLDDGSATIPATYLGALGNDWEDFCLVPGANTIAADYSDFTTTAPTFVMKYRERFL